jgi:tripartite-type tricarboxylate transporter receptor subunit TctC
MRITQYAAALTLAMSCAAFAQDYPTKPVRLITTEPGGSGDLVGRLIAGAISAPLGQQVVVDNRSAIPGIEAVAKAAPDGYTLLLPGAAMWIGPLLQPLSFDPVNDFTPVTLLIRQPNILAVHPSLPVTNVKQLIAIARARPNDLSYGSAPVGGSTHLAAELFKYMAGVSILRVPYKGTGPAMNALLSGEVQVMFPTAGAVMPLANSGRLRPLAVTTAQPSALAPGMPTVAASGVPGYESASMLALFAPAKTPAAVIARLNQEVVRALARTDVKEKLASVAMEAAGGPPGELMAAVKGEMERMGKVIKATNMRAD